ncbi:MAG: chitobiase/beta-hexosaminidase C-terminal domain-containing protein [Lachnospiraceae bacterium]|nr:chitobiase/beta-hexosaminidase C-terminal domain-containing protein [Lachnospiraceae bacterium]
MRKSIIPAVILFSAAVALAVGVFFYYSSRQNSREGMMHKAVQCAQEGDYRQAVTLLDRAVSIPHEGPPTNERLYLMKAEYLEKDGAYDEALSLAMRVMKNSALESQEYDESWQRIVSICTNTKSFEKLSMLLDGCEKESIRQDYAAFYCIAPRISEPSGNYYDAITVYLTSEAQGSIFYTLDGSEPDEHSTLYSGNIVLPPGDYTLRAVLVNLYGVRSKPVSAEYHIEGPEEE